MILRTVVLLALLSLLAGGCAITPQYRVESMQTSFSMATMKRGIAVAQLDAVTPSAALNAGAAFGILGVLIADAATSGAPEILGMRVHGETMKLLGEEMAARMVNYVPLDGNNGATDEQVIRRIKSNRLAGFSALGRDELERFFQKYADVGYAMHVTSWVNTISRRQLLIDAEWTIYDRSGSQIAKIRTRSISAEDRDIFSDETYLAEFVRLQRTNIREFLKLIPIGA